MDAKFLVIMAFAIVYEHLASGTLQTLHTTEVDQKS